MTTTNDDRDTALLPGAPIIVGIRSLVIWAVVAATGLAVFLRGTTGGCRGGYASNGRDFLGPDGQPTDLEPMCGTITMGPSPLIFAILAIVVVASLTRVLGRATDVDQALRILGNARMAVVVIALIALAVGYIALTLVHVEDWRSFSVWSPLPFAEFSIQTHPITQN